MDNNGFGLEIIGLIVTGIGVLSAMFLGFIQFRNTFRGRSLLRTELEIVRSMDSLGITVGRVEIAESIRLRIKNLFLPKPLGI
jgi:hypothetical protein